jgi:DNA-binding beta-propeller fold protein YncE
MPAASRAVFALASVSLLALAATGAQAESPSVIQEQMPIPHFQEFEGEIGFVQMGGGAPFQLQGAPVGDAQAPASTPADAATRGSHIAAYRGGSIVADADSGKLIRTDDNGTKTAELMLGVGVSQVVVDAKAKRAYVSDRHSDRIVVVDLGAGLELGDAFSTDSEPFGIALSPDRGTLLVTTVADHSLSALDVATGLARWTVDIGPEPRGVAIAPDGGEALVTFLGTGTVARVDLSATKRARPKISYLTLDPASRQAAASSGFGGLQIQAAAGATEASPDLGKTFARNAFAVQYVGHSMAVVPHQLSTPHLASGDDRVEVSGYGGGNGFTPPVAHRLAFLGMPDSGSDDGVRMAMASTNLHQPRAAAYDGRTDTLYVAGYGSDDVMAVANVSQASVRNSWTAQVGAGCGPDGLAVDPDDGHVLVWCSLQRKVVRLAGDPARAEAPKEVWRSGELSTSRLSEDAQRGQDLFRRGNSAQISTGGAMACSSCHAEARADGLSWRLQGKNLQTPLLAGRITEGAHPFKWDGKDPTITASLTNTVTRLGGTGISTAEADDIAAFLAALPPPRAPKADDPKAVARGKKLFEGELTGCITCHSGALLTDQNQYDLASDLDEVDTPSLVGLASSAPYYHDGSAATLDALLRDNGSIHGMGDVAALTDGQISDLVQYMKTL